MLYENGGTSCNVGPGAEKFGQCSGPLLAVGLWLPRNLILKNSQAILHL